MAKIDALFKHLRDQEGSDLFLVVGEPPKMRVHGKVVTVQGAPNLTVEMVNALLLEILSTEQKKSFAEDRDLDFAHALEGLARFRCNYFYQNAGPAAVFRIIPEKIKPLADLN